LVGLGEAIDLIQELGTGTGMGMSPPEVAAQIFRVFDFWQRLRSVRVELDESQFKVLRAIKKGHRDLNGITAYTGLTETDTRDAVSSLLRMRYKEDVPLLEQVGDMLTTQF
jgi:hypothetical protein